MKNHAIYSPYLNLLNYPYNIFGNLFSYPDSIKVYILYLLVMVFYSLWIKGMSPNIFVFFFTLNFGYQEKKSYGYMYTSLWVYISFLSFGKITRTRISGLYGKWRLNFIRNCFLKYLYNFTLWLAMYKKVLVARHTHQNFVVTVF